MHPNIHKNLDVPQELTLKKRGVLAQVVLATSPTTIFTFDEGERVEISHVVISNVTNQGRWISLWLDDDGTTYDDTTNLHEQQNVAGNSTIVLDEGLYMDNFLGSIGMESQTTSTHTVTIFGSIYTVL